MVTLSEDSPVSFPLEHTLRGQFYRAIKTSKRELLSLHQVQADRNQDPVIKNWMFCLIRRSLVNTKN